MKIKIFLITALSFLLLVSMSQVFSIPPFSGDIFSFYKSGYFREIDTQFTVIKDSFLRIKMYARPEYAWIFLEDMRNHHGIQIKVYDSRGNVIPAPGEKLPGADSIALKTIHSINPVFSTAINKNMYYAVIPIPLENHCKFCHNRNENTRILGAMTFERPFNPVAYYTSERIIIFVIISVVISLLLLFTIRWDPEKKIKELFDK
jgi:hypothetical protein